jgi:L-asparagine transporter-like permease
MKNKIALAFLALSDKFKKLKQSIEFKVFVQFLAWLIYYLVYGMVAIMLTAKDDLMVLFGLIIGVVLFILVISRLSNYIKWIVKKIDEKE